MTTAPAYKGHQSTTNAGLTAIPVNVPSSGGPAVGDWMVAIIHTTASGGVTHNTAAPTDSGWTQVLAPSLLSSRILQVYAKRRTSTDPNTWSFTQEKTGTALSDVVWGSGGLTDLASWLKGAFSKGANLTTQTTPGVSGAVTNSLAISIQAEATSATESDVMTVDSPFTKLYWTIVSGSSPINSLLIATRTMTADGATGDAVSRAWPNQTGNRGSFMLVIPPAADAAVAKLPAKVVVSTGTVADVGLTAIDSSGKEVAISKLEFVHGGTMVPDLDRTSRVWTMGHRGGSVDYQEHSPEGYLNCAINHVDVFEFSVGITKDKKFFGIHDGTFSRTSSSVASTVKTTDLTWAEVQALAQDLPGRADTRYGTSRYMGLDEFIERWSPSHTLMFDPKLISSADRPALYSRLQQIPDYRRRVLGKFYSTGTTIADEFAAIGVGSWGYSYEADVGALDANGNFVVRTDPNSAAATANKWKYLGLDYGASDKAWAAMRAIAGDKKIIGHICPSVSAARSAVDKGAKALQVSGVRAVSAAY